MGFLIKGSLVLTIFMLIGFFAAYELMGIPALADLEESEVNIHKRAGTDNTTSTPVATEGNAQADTTSSNITLDCLDEGYQIDDFCNVTETKPELLGALITFEDLGNILFIDDVVDDLQTTCNNSSWCLTLEDQQRLYTELGESYLAFCGLTDCLLQVPDECMTDERRLVLASLFIMCRAAEEDATGECLLAIRQMTHVAMADLYREIDGEDDPDSCHSADNKTCGGPCYELGWQLHCMCAICDHNMDMLVEFKEWQWFYAVDDAMTQCGINDTESQCEMFIQPEVFFIEYGAFYELLDSMDPRALVGIAIACLVSFGGIGIVIWVCTCRLRRSSRDRIEYTEVKSSEIQALIESEEIEEDILPA